MTIGLHVAEELVVLALARRQLQCAGGEAFGGEDLDAMAIQVIAIGNLPAQFDGVRIQRARTQRERLLDRPQVRFIDGGTGRRSEEHTSDLQSLMRSSYAVFCLNK